jgi:hypothetical protein
VESEGTQVLRQIVKDGGSYVTSEMGEVQFVPLVGKYGYEESVKRGENPC